MLLMNVDSMLAVRGDDLPVRSEAFRLPLCISNLHDDMFCVLVDEIGISDLMILVISISLFVEMPFWCLSRV